MHKAHRNYITDLDAVRDEWEHVHYESSEKSPILSFEHITLWYRCFSPSDSIRVYRISENGKAIGFIPMIMEKRNGIHTLSNLINDHTCYGDILFRKGSESALKSRLIDEILSDGTWDVLNHRFCYSFSDSDHVLPEGYFKKGYYSFLRKEPTYTVILNNSFDRYYISRSSNMRSHLNRCKKRLSTSSHKFKHYQGSDAVELWPEFLRIEDSGWKGKNGTSILKSGEQYQRYYNGFINLLSKTNNLHLYFLELENKNIAGVFGFTAGDIFQYSKIGYDEEYQSYSPSHLLYFFLVEDVIKSGLGKRIHLYPYDDSGYKARYANEESTFSDITVYNRTIAGHGSYYLDKLKKRIARNPILAEHIRHSISGMKNFAQKISR